MVKESDFLKLLQKHKIDMNENDVKEMFQFINGDEGDNKNSGKKEGTISSENFRNFYFDFK